MINSASVELQPNTSPSFVKDCQLEQHKKEEQRQSLQRVSKGATETKKVTSQIYITADKKQTNVDSEKRNEHLCDVRGRNAELAGVFYNQRRAKLLDSGEVRAKFNLMSNSTGTNFENVSDIHQSSRISPEPNASSSKLLLGGCCETEDFMKPTSLRKKRKRSNSCSGLLRSAERIVPEPSEEKGKLCYAPATSQNSTVKKPYSNQLPTEHFNFVRWLHNESQESAQQKQLVISQTNANGVTPLQNPEVAISSCGPDESQPSYLNPSVFQLKETSLRTRKKTFIEQQQQQKVQLCQNGAPDVTIAQTQSTPDHGIQVTQNSVVAFLPVYRPLTTHSESLAEDSSVQLGQVQVPLIQSQTTDAVHSGSVGDRKVHEQLMLPLPEEEVSKHVESEYNYMPTTSMCDENRLTPGVLIEEDSSVIDNMGDTDEYMPLSGPTLSNYIKQLPGFETTPRTSLVKLNCLNQPQIDTKELPKDNSNPQSPMGVSSNKITAQQSKSRMVASMTSTQYVAKEPSSGSSNASVTVSLLQIEQNLPGRQASFSNLSEARVVIAQNVSESLIFAKEANEQPSDQQERSTAPCTGNHASDFNLNRLDQITITNGFNEHQKNVVVKQVVKTQAHPVNSSSVTTESGEESDLMDVADELIICSRSVDPSPDILVEDLMNSSIQAREKCGTIQTQSSEKEDANGTKQPLPAYPKSTTMTVEEIQGTVQSVGRLINALTDGTMQTQSSEDEEEEDPISIELREIEEESRRPEHVCNENQQQHASSARLNQTNASASASITEQDFLGSQDSPTLVFDEKPSGSLIEIEGLGTMNLLSCEEKRAQLVEKFGTSEVINEEEENQTLSSCISPEPSEKQRQIYSQSNHTQWHASHSNQSEDVFRTQPSLDNLDQVVDYPQQSWLTERTTSERFKKQLGGTVQALQELSALPGSSSASSYTNKHKKFTQVASSLDGSRKGMTTSAGGRKSLKKLKNNSNATFTARQSRPLTGQPTKLPAQSVINIEVSQTLKNQSHLLDKMTHSTATTLYEKKSSLESTSSTTQDSNQSKKAAENSTNAQTTAPVKPRAHKKTLVDPQLRAWAIQTTSVTPPTKSGTSMIKSATQKGLIAASRTPGNLKPMTAASIKLSSYSKTKSEKYLLHQANNLSGNTSTGQKLPQIKKQRFASKAGGKGSIEILDASATSSEVQSPCPSKQVVSRNHATTAINTLRYVLKSTSATPKVQSVAQTYAKTFESRKQLSLSPMRNAHQVLTPHVDNSKSIRPPRQSQRRNFENVAGGPNGTALKRVPTKFYPPFKESIQSQQSKGNQQNSSTAHRVSPRNQNCTQRTSVKVSENKASSQGGPNFRIKPLPTKTLQLKENSGQSMAMAKSQIQSQRKFKTRDINATLGGATSDQKTSVRSPLLKTPSLSNSKLPQQSALAKEIALKAHHCSEPAAKEQRIKLK